MLLGFHLERSYFEIITCSRSASISNREDLAGLTIGLLENAMPLPKAVRLLGVSLSSLQGENDMTRNWISGFEPD
jgi:hypothetical protein